MVSRILFSQILNGLFFIMIYFTFLDKDKWLFCHLFVYFDSKTKSVFMILKQAANFVKNRDL